MSIDAVDLAVGMPRSGFPRPPIGGGTERDARFVLVMLAHHASDVDGCTFVSRNRLADACGLDRGVTGRCLQALADAALISDTGRRVGRGAIVWRVLPDRWTPQRGTSDRTSGLVQSANDDRTSDRTSERTSDRTSGLVPNRTEQNHPPTPQHNTTSPPTEPAGTEGTHSEGTSDLQTADEIIDAAAKRAARTNEFNGRGAAGPGALRKLRNEAALHSSLIDEWTARGSTTSAIADALAERVTGNPSAAPRDLAPVHCETCDGTRFVEADDPSGRPGSAYSAPCPTCQPDRVIA